MNLIHFTCIFIFFFFNVCDALTPAAEKGSLAVENIANEALMTQIIARSINLPNGLLQWDHNYTHSDSSSSNHPPVNLRNSLKHTFKRMYSDFFPTILELFDIWSISRNVLNGVSNVIHTIAVGLEPRRESLPSKAVNRVIEANLNKISFHLDEESGCDGLCYMTEGVMGLHCSPTANNLPALYVPVDPTASRLILPGSNSLSFFVLSVISLYVVNCTVAKYRSQLAFIFCDRPPNHKQVLEPIGFNNAASTWKNSDESIDYMIPALFEEGNITADFVCPPHSATTWEPILSSNGIGPKEIYGKISVPASDGIETLYEVESEKHDPAFCYRPKAATTTQAYNVSLQCEDHGGVDIEPFILDLETLVMSHTKTCFPADDYPHLPERVMPLPPFEFDFVHCEKKKKNICHEDFALDRFSTAAGPTVQQLLPFSADNENMLYAENHVSRTEAKDEQPLGFYPNPVSHETCDERIECEEFVRCTGIYDDLSTNLGQEGQVELTNSVGTKNVLNALEDFPDLHMEVVELAEPLRENWFDVLDMLFDTEYDSEGSIYSDYEPEDSIYSNRE